MPLVEIIEFESKIDKLEKLKLFYVEISNSIIDKLNENEKKAKLNHRVKIILNNQIEWQAGIVALGEGKGYITLSNARMKKLNLHFLDTVSITLQKDNSEFGFDMPIELIEVFNQSLEAKIKFDLLTPSKKRYIIYHVLQVKSSDKRIERAINVSKNLEKIISGKENLKFILGKAE